MGGERERALEVFTFIFFPYRAQYIELSVLQLLNRIKLEAVKSSKSGA